MERSWSVVLVLAALVPLLTGCMPVAGAIAGPSLAVGTTAATGKTPVDHVVSLVTGKDCSVLRNRQGLTYCREDEPTMPIGVICYRSLGDVACYDRRDPYNGGERPVVDARSPPLAGPPSDQPAAAYAVEHELDGERGKQDADDAVDDVLTGHAEDGV
jgi:hypothetical protein